MAASCFSAPARSTSFSAQPIALSIRYDSMMMPATRVRTICSFSISVLHVLQELLIERIGLLFGQLAGVDQHAEAEGRFLSRLQRVIQRRRAFGELFCAEGIRREEAVAARVPVCRIGRILRVIEDGEHDVLAFDIAG